MNRRLAIVPFMLIALSLAAGCKESTVARKMGKSRDMYPDQQSWKSSITISREGMLVAKADSEEMIKYDEQNLAHLRGNVKIDFFNNLGDHVSRMFSDSADVNMLNNNLVAIGNVVIQSDSGLVLHTNVLNWSHEYDMVETDDSVMFATTDQDTLYGVGFESDVDLTHWKIYRPSGVVGPGIGNVN